MSTITTALKPTKDELDDARFKAYAAEGFIKQRGGKDYPDVDPVAHIALAKVLEHRCESRADRKTGMLPVADVAAAAFPATPSPESDGWDANDPLMVALWHKLVSDANGLLKSGRRGVVQGMLAEDEATQDLVLCERRMGTPQVQAVYVTTNATLIDDDYTTPRAARLLNVSAELTSDLEEVVIARHPEQASKVRGTWKKAEGEAVAAAKAKLQITAGDGN